MRHKTCIRSRIVNINDSKTSLNAKTNKIIEMKQFVIKAYDGEDKLDKRMEVRPHHFEGMEKMKEHILCARGLSGISLK